MPALGALYAAPEIRMRPTEQPLGTGSGQSVRVGDLAWSDEVRGGEPVGGENFGDLLAAGIQKTAELGHVAESKAQDFARGALDDLHGTMISAKEAEISMRLVGSVRSKLIDAFHELWRINV